MKFTFIYEETLSRRVAIDAKCLSDAIKEVERRIDEEEIVLDSEDFDGAELKMPLEDNFFPMLQLYGENIKNKKDLDIVIDCW